MDLDRLWELWKAEGAWLGNQVDEAAKDAAASVFESAMRAIWDASLAVLKAAFKLADRLSVFSITGDDGPLEITWPTTLWISGVVALGLFFWQLVMTTLRGGRGFTRLVSGPLQYGVALGVTVGLVATMLVAADELTRGLLDNGLSADNFQEAFQHTNFSSDAVKGVKTVVLGLCALFGVLPAAFGYVLEMLFREAAIHVLVAVVPITAAGLLAGVTANWFWKTVRWMLAAIAMKPLLALTLVLGVAIAGGSKGISGLLVGAAVLLISLFAPFVLFRLLAFVDPNTDAGAGFRNALASLGTGSYGTSNPITGWMMSHADGNDSTSAAAGASSASAEATTTRRFDESAEAHSGTASTAGTDAADGAGRPAGTSGDSTGRDNADSSADLDAGAHPDGPAASDPSDKGEITLGPAGVSIDPDPGPTGTANHPNIGSPPETEATGSSEADEPPHDIDRYDDGTVI